MDYQGGSQWRKWDLHVHTPESVLNNGFGANWDNYVKELFTALINKQIRVVGITDYFTIDGYKKLKEEYLQDEAKLRSLFTDEQISQIRQITVIPNIEFRSNILVDTKRINFHVLLSEDLRIQDIQEMFLEEIDFVYQGEPQRPDTLRKLRTVNLSELGARLKAEHSTFTESDLKTGMLNAVVDHEQVSRILASKKATFGGKYLFVVMSDEDLSELQWNSQNHHTRKILIQKSDLLFSSNPNTRNWALGSPPYREGQTQFIKEFQSLKACIHGSDAHAPAFIGHPCAKRGVATHTCRPDSPECELRYCWIKADPTFEGLRQILYEPSDRVKIQNDDPTPLRSSQTIREFNFGPSKIDNELQFATSKLPLNEGLVAVTGGKGSGKTAYVDLLANIYEDRARCTDKNSFVRRVAEDLGTNTLHTAIALQGDQRFAKEIRERSFIEGASIVYVAQGELERHLEHPAHLEQHISDLIFNSSAIKDSQVVFDYSSVSEEIETLNDKVIACNSITFGLEKDTAPSIENELRKDNGKLVIDQKDTDAKIAELAKQLTPEKIKEAQEKQKRLTELRERKERLMALGTTIKEALRFIDEDLVAFNERITSINELSTSLGMSAGYSAMQFTKLETLREFIATVRTELRKTIAELDTFQKALEETEKGAKTHAKLLDRQKELERALQALKTRGAALVQKKSELQVSRELRHKLFAELLSKYIEWRAKYIELINVFRANKSETLNDLEFGAELIFDQSHFEKAMSELVDQRKLRVRAFEELESDIKFFTDAMNDFAMAPNDEKVSSIANGIIDKLLEKVVASQKAAVTADLRTIFNAVFKSYLTVVPTVKYKNIKLNKLSMGQKATVLLKIYLAQGENPIVIDSHDDHLDNEFIMDELVRALREAKLRRQVIIVSNNGNIVINSDADQVIMASRDDSGLISYESGSLENPRLRPRLLKVLEGGELAFSKRQQKYRLAP